MKSRCRYEKDQNVYTKVLSIIRHSVTRLKNYLGRKSHWYKILENYITKQNRNPLCLTTAKVLACLNSLCISILAFWAWTEELCWGNYLHFHTVTILNCHRKYLHSKKIQIWIGGGHRLPATCHMLYFMGLLLWVPLLYCTVLHHTSLCPSVHWVTPCAHPSTSHCTVLQVPSSSRLWSPSPPICSSPNSSTLYPRVGSGSGSIIRRREGEPVDSRETSGRTTKGAAPRLRTRGA